MPIPDGSEPDARLFSGLARELAPRALVRGRLPGATDPLAELWVRSLGLPTRRELVRRGASIEAFASGLRLRLPLSALSASGSVTESELDLLRSTWCAATAPATPTLVMGILNVTNDSFSDGGQFADPESALQQGLKLLAQGADILDVGGESTRPGARAVSVQEELDRVIPVIERLVDRASPVISIDTQKAPVAEAALRAGASIVNDVSAGLNDPELFAVTARADAGLILMHMQGTPETMQQAPRYGDVVGEVTEHLRSRVAHGLKAGVALSKIWVDPGIGFGKRLQDNVMLLRATSELRSLGLPVLIGVSRKTCLGQLSQSESGEATRPPAERDVETQAAIALTTALGAAAQRVHDVAPTRRTLKIAQALRSADSSTIKENSSC